MTKQKKSFSADWLVGGILTRVGETFDRLTGRGWKPSSSLATSELIDRLKKLLDAEVRDLGEKGRFVPHNIKLKMQWNKFSTDSDDALRKLEYEMLAAAIDHINDNRYHTYQPLKIDVKPDYFTEGIKFLASFDEFAEEEKEAVINITVPQIRVGELVPEPEVVEQEPDSDEYIAEFTAKDKPKQVELKFQLGKRVGVGRTKENDLAIDDPSVSKIHAALVVNTDRQMMVADTGSTNGTFINGQRIAYGKAFPVGEGDKLKFGTVEVYLRPVPKQTAFEPTASYQADDFRTGNISTGDIANTDIATSQNLPTVQDPVSASEIVAAASDLKPTVNSQPIPASIQVPLPNQPPINLPVARQPVEAPLASTTPAISKPAETFSGPLNKEPNNTISSNDTNAAIPVPQPNFVTAEDIKVEPPPAKIEPAPLNRTVPPPVETEFAPPEFTPDENPSQVFSTEPRVKLNFDDDEK